MKNTYPVNEIFPTIQAEARFAGTPSVFIRLQGCDVGCPWCDTKHTWVVDKSKVIPIQEMLIKTNKATENYCVMTCAAILKAVSQWQGVKHIVITGGEPFMYDLAPLVIALREKDLTVQIETSGTYPIQSEVEVRSWITLSPKIEMPGGREFINRWVDICDEVKYPVGKQTDIDKLTSILPDNFEASNVWMQPLSCSNKATQLCVDTALLTGWKVSIQSHKYIGIR